MVNYQANQLHTDCAQALLDNVFETSHLTEINVSILVSVKICFITFVMSKYTE